MTEKICKVLKPLSEFHAPTVSRTNRKPDCYNKGDKIWAKQLY